MNQVFSPQVSPHVSAVDCDAALAHVLAAPRDRAPITQICLRTGYGERSFPEQLRLTRAEGVVGDRWLSDPWLKRPNGGPDPRIQVSILGQRVRDLCCHGLHPGDPIIADIDLSEGNLPTGSRLRLGSAVVEVSDYFNNGCRKWRDRYGQDSLSWINRRAYRHHRLRGVLCAVVEDGVVRAGDLIEKI